MRQGYGSQSNLSSWRFSVGSVPLNERRSRERNGEKMRALQLSCSRCSDRGDGAKRCEQEKQRWGGKGGESFSPASSSPYFSPTALLCTALHYLNAWNRLLHKQTGSYTGFRRTRLNKLKNTVLVLQKAINTQTYVITSTTILNWFHPVYIHLLKCPPQTHCHFHCPPLFALQDV